jgi:hyperosmotically inducible periplasmic protein
MMRKAYCLSVLLLVCFGLTSAGYADSSTTAAAAAQQTAAPSPQTSNAPLSPEARAKLIQKIQSALIKLPYFGVFDNIAFELQGRTVTLLGSVTSEHSQTKQDAERAVKKIEGVEGVINNIEVLPPAPVDARIRQQVYDAIYNYGPLFKYKNDRVNPPIRIIVKNSRVTLEGVVDTETDKGLCTLRANQVPGVFSVTNNLRVAKG